MDSMTLYRGMEIGTAKPTAAERDFVPHHLFDILNIDQAYSVAEYVADAAGVVSEILQRGGTPIFVGGTGLYLRSLLRGVFEGPPGDSALRKRLNEEWNRLGAEAMHVRLQSVDPVTAARLAVNDGRRIMRALEVLELTGQPLSAWHSEDEPDTVARHVYWLEPQRPELHGRINLRVDKMIASGWLDECRALLASEYELGPTARQALGYQELFSVIEDGENLAAITERIKARTRQFAKRQHTWFRNLDECHAIPISPDETAEAIAYRIHQIDSADNGCS